VVWFWQNTLWGVYSSGWSGYADEPATGPDTSTGAYYTMLNLHPNTMPEIGNQYGTATYSLHAIPDHGGLNIWYHTNWVWQADIYGEIYDSPLATPPTDFLVPNYMVNYMTSAYYAGGCMNSNEAPNDTGCGAAIPAFTGTVGMGGSGGWFNMQGAQGVCPAESPTYGGTGIPSCSISGGENITLVFDQNITFTDGVRLNAYDYNYSLFASDISCPTATPDAVTPDTGVDCGPSGLISTYIPPSNPYEIQIFLGEDTVWGLVNTIVPVVPAHVWQDTFNQDYTNTGVTAIDPVMTYAGATSAGQCGPDCDFIWVATHPGVYRAAPASVQYLPNLLVGSGPFYMYTYKETTGSGELVANPTYFHTAYWSIAVDPSPTTSFKFTLTKPLELLTYNAGTGTADSPLSGITLPTGCPAVGKTAYCLMENVTGT